MKQETIDLIKFLKDNIDDTVLKERYRQIITYRWGLKDNTSHTLEETGKMFGITRERVRQIVAKTVEIIKQSGVDKLPIDK